MTEIPIDITEAAGEWLDVLTQEPVAANDKRRFLEWLNESPVHVAEFLHVSAIRSQLHEFGGSQPAEIKVLLAEVSSGNVVDIPVFSGPTNRPGLEKTRLPMQRSRLLILGLVASLMVVFLWFHALSAKTISTEIGELRVVVLEDGSKLELNTSSRVKIEYSDKERIVELIEGELLIEVAKDEERPLIVQTDRASVIATGTLFNVYRKPEVVEVTVIEGSVLVNTISYKLNRSKTESYQVSVGAGNKTVVAEKAISEPTQVNVDKVTAWTERRLTFEGSTVNEVVAEFNRYNKELLVIRDPDLAVRKISGVFDVNDPGAFITLLSELDDIDVSVTNQGYRELRLKSR